MKKTLLFAIFIFVLQACSALSVIELAEEDTQNISVEETAVIASLERSNSEEYLYYYVAHSFSNADIQSERSDKNRETSGVQTESNGYGHLYSFNGEKSLILSEIVSKMADQLLYNFPVKYHNESIALTSIVDLKNHKETNWLGQTISEQFIHELHIRKLRIIDFKLTGNIQLTQTGEFALTRDWKKLNKNIDVQRILTGTMSRNEEGIIINVRIVNVNSNLVESTSSAFIPHSLFVGGEYDYQSKKYFSRDSRLTRQGKAQVRLVK